VCFGCTRWDRWWTEREHVVIAAEGMMMVAVAKGACDGGVFAAAAGVEGPGRVPFAGPATNGDGDARRG